MAYALKHSGPIILPGSRAVVCEEEPGTPVPLDEWIRFTKESPRMREVLHLDQRPSAVYASPKGEEIEVVFFFGRVTALHEADRERVAILQEMVDHLNKFTKRA